MRGSKCAATLVNKAGQRNTRVRVVDPQCLVTEDLLAELLAARVACDCVGCQRVQVNDECVGNEGVEEDFDTGTALERAALRELGGCANRVFVAGKLFRMFEGVQKGGNVEGDQVLLTQGREWNAAGLDEERVACFHG